MLKCWNYCPENRPTFRHCLDALKDLKEKTSGSIQIVAQFPDKVISGKFLPICTSSINQPIIASHLHNSKITSQVPFLTNHI